MEFPVSPDVEEEEEKRRESSRWRDGFNDFWGLAFSSDERKEGGIFKPLPRPGTLLLHATTASTTTTLAERSSRSSFTPGERLPRSGVGGGLFRDERKRYGEGERKASGTRVEG